MEDNLTRGKFIDPVDRAFVAENWAGRGYSCQMFVDPPGQQWNDFVHRTNELVTVVEGRLAMIVEGVRSEMGPGNVLKGLVKKIDRSVEFI